MTEQNTVEINLMDMFRMILSRWRAMIVGAVIGGFLFGMFTLICNYKSLTDPAVIASNQEAYESNVEVYELSREQLQARVDSLKDSLEQQQYIEEHNVIFRIDPYNEFVESATFYVDTGYEVSPELTYQNPDKTSAVINSYRTVVQRIDVNGILGEYLGEDIMTDNPIKGTSYYLVNSWTEPANGLLFIFVCGTDRGSVDAVMDALEAEIQAAEKDYQTIYGEHTITLIENSKYQKIDLDLLTVHTSFSENMETIREALTASEEELNSLKAPTLGQYGLRALAKKTIRYGMIGAVVGIVATMVWVVLCYVLQEQMWSLREVQRRYGVRVLGAYPGKLKALQTKLDKRIARKFGVNVWSDPDRAACYIKERIHLEIKENAVVLCGTEETDILSSVCESLKIADPEVRYTIAGNLILSDEAVSTVNSAKAAILVERWRKTSLRVLQEELETVWTVLPKEKTAVVVVL